MASFATQYTLAIVIQEITRGNAISNARSNLTDMGAAGERAGNRTFTAMERLKQGVLGVARTVSRVMQPALALAALGATRFAKEAALEFAEYDQQLREVFSLAPDLAATQQAQIREQIMSTGVEYGRLTDETIPALYQAISLGIDPNNAPAAVEIAAQAATAAVADLESTMITGLTIMNAHNLAVEDLGHIYDVLQTMIRFGFIRMDEMNRVMGPLSKTASDSGTSLEDMAAAMITLTRQGQNAGDAAELLNFLLLQLATDGTAAFKAFEEASGQSYRNFIRDGGTLIDALQIMNQHAIDTGQSLTTMIAGDSKFYRDQQAARAVMGLTGDKMDDLVEQANNVANAAGAMGTAFKEVSEGVQFDIDRNRAALEEFKLSLGEFAAGGIAIGDEEISTGTVARGGTSFFKAASGNFGKQIEDLVETRLTAQRTFEDMLNDLIDFQDNYTQAYLFKGARGSIRQGIEQTTIALIEQSGSLEAVNDALVRLNIGAEWPNGQVFIRELNTTTEALWAEHEAAIAAAQAGEDRTMALKDAADADRIILNQLEKKIDLGPQALADLTSQAKARTLLNAQLREEERIREELEARQAAEAERFRVMSEQAGGFFGTISGITEDLFRNYEDLNRTEEEWFERYLEHADQITTISGELAENATIAEMFGLTEDEASDVAEEIGESLLEIKAAYDELALSIVEAELMEKFGGATAEAQVQIIRLKEAMGTISSEQATFLEEQIRQADQLDTVLQTMLSTYLEEGGLSAIESENIANAIALIEEKANLTDEAIIRVATGVSTKSAEMRTAIEENPTAAMTRLETKMQEMEDEEWKPEVEVDKDEADRALNDFESQITSITEKDWVATIRVRTVGLSAAQSQVGGIGGVGHHAGGDFTVPNRPEYRGDGYLARLDAGERVSVRTPSQARRDKMMDQARGGYVDNSQTTIINENSQAAAVALAWQDRERERRVNTWME
jgi:TP901 family phage tail tape measure protein